MEILQGMIAPARGTCGFGSKPCAMALAVALALGLSGCGGGGGGANVRPTPPPPTGGTGFTGGKIDVGGNGVTVLSEDIGGSSDLIKGGTGTLVITGTDTYTGGTTINLGTLQIGNGGTTGSITGDVIDNGALVFNRSDNVTFDGIVSGAGSLRQAGVGSLTLTGANTYAGGTTIDRGTLQIGNGGITGSIAGNLIDNGAMVFNRSDNVTFNGIVNGSGSLRQAGNGTLTLTGANSYAGTTQVDAGGLYVDGDQSAATGTTTVANGALLGGKGIFGGDLNLADGATLAPGSNGAIGTLTINGSLRLSAGSMLDYTLGQANTVGGQFNDLIDVNGNLMLDGTINVGSAQAGSFGPGLYRVFNYTGSLTNHGLALGTIPFSGVLVQTGVAQQVNLINTDGMTFSFWDGDAGPKDNNAINGGNGTWERGSPLSNNWADASGAVNAPYSDRSFAVFQAKPGQVTVDDGNGDINVAGMQFASNGYVIQGDTVHLIGSTDDPARSIIRVGDGTTAGAGYKAIINSVLDGDSTLVKTDAGTLVLGGANTYTGGTTIDGGTLQLGNGGTTGSITGDVTDNGSLRFNRSDAMVFNNIVSGSGALVQAGIGALTLTAASTYAGGTTVEHGILEVAPGATPGTGSITVGSYDIDYYESDYYSVPTLQVDGGVSLSNPVVLIHGELNNAGTLGGRPDNAVWGAGDLAAVLNHDGGSIKGKNSGVMVVATGPGSVHNSSGGIIEGGNLGVGLGYGGTISNDGVGSIIRSSGGPAIQVSGNSGTVKNTGGGTITGGSTAIYLQYGGSVTNDSGSTIETTGTKGGDCAGTGDCAIFVASDNNRPGSFHGALTLLNAGTIIGNVQMLSTAPNSVTLSAGSSIQGDLDIGSRGGLTLNGDAGTVQLYSHAVTGTTTFAGGLSKQGDGTWIIDKNNFTGIGIALDGGTLQIGNGGTEGSISQGDVTLHRGNLVFDRSDDVIFQGSILGGGQNGYDGTLVQAGAGTLTLPLNLTTYNIVPPHIRISSGTLQIDNTGDIPSSSCLCITMLSADVVNDGSLVFNSNWTIYYGGLISGAGSVTQNGSGDVILQAPNTYTGGTTINNGLVQSPAMLPGNVVLNGAGTLDGYSGATLHSGVPGVTGNLSNAGKMFIHAGDSTIGGNYTHASTGTLAVSLGSKLDVVGSATLSGGTLEVTGADNGYVSNTHTNVLTAAGGVTGTFDQLVKGTGVVFTATTINYDANSVWLDTTGLDVTTAAAGNGVVYTPVSFGSAQRVQGAFEQLDSKLAAGNLSGVSSDFVRAAGQFQQTSSLQAAQASLQSLSGQLHAASAAMTFEAIDASSRALSDRFDHLLDKGTGFGMWTHNLSVGGDMARAGFDGVGFQLNGWLVGSDRQVGHSGVAGFAFGQSQGQQRLNRSLDHDNSRNTEGMLYAGGLNGHWYTQGRVGFGRFQQDVSRQILLGENAQGVRTQYSGSYDVAYGESGLHFGGGNSHVTPFVDVQYARVNRDGFAEQGAGGFGLRSNAQTLDRWQAGLGVRAGHRWNLDGGPALDFSARAQWQRTLASHGDVFDASFVGLQQWQPLVGIGLSRYSGLFGVGLDATLSARTALKFSYDYQTGQRNQAQMLSARLNVAF